MTGLSNEDRKSLLVACACGHDINDHGSLCWVCVDEGRGCRVEFEELLVERLEAIVQRAVTEALTEAAHELRLMAAEHMDHNGPRDERGAAVWDAATWLVEDFPARHRIPN